MAISQKREREGILHHIAQNERRLEAGRKSGTEWVIKDAERALGYFTQKLTDFDAKYPKAAGRAYGRQFSSGRVEIITCAGCGKQTTTGIDNTNLELCRACYAEAMYENQHNDEAHEGAMEDCPECSPKYRALLKGSK